MQPAMVLFWRVAPALRDGLEGTAGRGHPGCLLAWFCLPNHSFVRDTKPLRPTGLHSLQANEKEMSHEQH